MAVPLLYDRQYCLPDATDSVSVTPSGVSWGNSSWVELEDSMPTAGILTGITPLSLAAFSASPAVGYEFDIGVGSAGNEVVISTFRGSFAFIANTPSASGCPWIPCVFGIDAIPAGSRVAVRMRIASTNTTAWKVGVTYLRKPLTGSLETTTAPIKTWPPADTAQVLTLTSTWSNTAWAEVREASGAPTWYITGLVIWRLVGNTEIELDFGTGASSSESVIWTIRHFGTSMGNMLGMHVPIWNPISIPANTRLAVRARGTRPTGVNVDVYVALTYVESIG